MQLSVLLQNYSAVGVGVKNDSIGIIGHFKLPLERESYAEIVYFYIPQDA